MDASSPVPFHTFLWKIASRCNLACTYCYVYSLADGGWRNQPGFMSSEVARRAAQRMREHLEQHDKRDAAIVFHGGEPMLGGVSQMSDLATIILETFAGSSIRISVGMQSNLLLFTPEIGDLMLSLGLTVGVSIDGPPRINDRFRIDHHGKGSSAALEDRLALLGSARYRPLFSGFLCVLDPDTDPIEVTDYLLSFDPPSIDFLFPLDNHDRRPRGKAGEHLNKTPYGDWLVRSFDRWMSRPNSTRIRLFQSMIQQLCGAPSLVESIGLDAVDLIVVETNGEIEGVDSLKGTYDGATKLGFDIHRHSFDEVAGHLAVRSRQLGLTSLSAACRTCPVVDVCGGGYLPHRYSAERNFDNPSVYCADLEKLIRHIHGTLRGGLRTMGMEAHA